MPQKRSPGFSLELDGKLGGCGIRVPVPDGCITDITCKVKTLHTAEQINARFKELAEGRLKGILRYTEDPIVSVDIVGDPNSCIFDAQLTSVVGNMVKVMGWYDNEYGYSSRLVDLVVKMGSDQSYWATAGCNLPVLPLYTAGPPVIRTSRASAPSLILFLSVICVPSNTPYVK